MSNSRSVILYIEDDENDVFLVQRAFERAGITHPLLVLGDGKTAIDYLAGNGPYIDRSQYPLPCLVLLDLNMPAVSGLDVLKWIRKTPSICTVLTVVLTSSSHNSDVHRAYLQGANGYLVKPSQLDDLVTMARAIKDYWLMQNRAITGEQASDNCPAGTTASL